MVTPQEAGANGLRAVLPGHDTELQIGRRTCDGPELPGVTSVRQIPRVKFPDDLPIGSFAREYAAKSRPCIIEGLIDDWPAHVDQTRAWRLGRWEEAVAMQDADSETVTICVGFDPSSNRMMHFGEDDPGVLFNPGRLRMSTWVFFEIGKLRQEILDARRAASNKIDGDCGVGEGLDYEWDICQDIGAELPVNFLDSHPDLKIRLSREVEVQNMPFLEVNETAPYLQHFAPVQCKLRDLVPLSFYLSHDTAALPIDMQKELWPQADKLIPEWGCAHSTRLWVTNGSPWRVPYPPWSEHSIPEPVTPYDPWIYSCFHCDKMENLHSVLAGEKQVVLVPPGHRDVLKATRHATQLQWLMVPVTSPSGGASYLGSTTFTSDLQHECSSSQSAVHPLKPPDENRRVSHGAWPDAIDFPVCTGRLRPGDTLFIPAYWWHWVATATPPALGLGASFGPLAMSVNFWYWPVHNDSDMEQWSYQVEVESHANARAPVQPGSAPPSRESHKLSFQRQAQEMRRLVATARSMVPSKPASEPTEEFEIVD